MGRRPSAEERELLNSVRDDWINEGLSTTPAERERAQWSVLSAYQEIGHGTGSHMFIWVDSPMAGVIASTAIGFALDEPLKSKLMKQLETATSLNIAAANKIRRDVDQQVWHRVRNAVHKNLKPWADAMMEGQFSAGTMAQLEALNLLEGLDLKPFAGLQKLARNCCWWWAFDVGAVLCERPTKIEIQGKRVTMEFRDGWKVG